MKPLLKTSPTAYDHIPEGYIKGRPTYIYDPGKPFGSVPYLFYLSDETICPGLGFHNPSFPAEPISYYTDAGISINATNIIAFKQQEAEKTTHLENLPYDDRYKLRDAIRQMGRFNWTHDFFVVGNMQTIIDYVFCAMKLANHQHLTNLDALEVADRNVYERIVRPFHQKIYQLLDELCDIRDAYNSDFNVDDFTRKIDKNSVKMYKQEQSSVIESIIATLKGVLPESTWDFIYSQFEARKVRFPKENYDAVVVSPKYMLVKIDQDKTK
jgi:hypothetical protein